MSTITHRHMMEDDNNKRVLCMQSAAIYTELSLNSVTPKTILYRETEAQDLVSFVALSHESLRPRNAWGFLDSQTPFFFLTEG